MARKFDVAIALQVGIEYHSAMTIRPIIIHPDPRLKKMATPVAEVTPAIRRLAEDMLETMYDAPGIGLAAPQIGVMSSVFVMDCVKEEGAAAAPMVLLNPVITWVSEELSTYEEGCLSIPEQYGEVERPAEIDMQWLDLDEKIHEQRFEGLWATCAQRA